MIVRVDVDTQNGFCDPAGGLYVRGAARVLENVARLNRDALEHRAALVGSLDSHDFASPEFRENGGPWPTHCVKGTWDWLKPASVLPARFRIVGREPTDVARAFAGGRAALYFEKDAYSIFDNRNFAALLECLRARGEGLRFEVYGVATDYCVKAAALELRRRGYDVALVRNAVAGVAEDTTAAAIEEMRAAGVEMTTTAEALGASACA